MFHLAIWPISLVLIVKKESKIDHCDLISIKIWFTQMVNQLKL